jgi:hypothetical protein
MVISNEEIKIKIHTHTHTHLFIVYFFDMLNLISCDLRSTHFGD